MSGTCLDQFQCGTHAPGWLVDEHPTVAEGAVPRKVCLPKDEHDCCSWESYIRVRNCSDYYVYELTPTPACALRYCGVQGKVYSFRYSSDLQQISPHNQSTHN